MTDAWLQSIRTPFKPKIDIVLEDKAKYLKLVLDTRAFIHLFILLNIKKHFYSGWSKKICK